MFPFTLFTSINISDRIASLREAEAKLLEFAKTRFALHSDHHQNSSLFELFDTPIATPSVLGLDNDAKKKCQVFNEVENYSIHGVKVVNEQLTSSQSTNDDTKQPAPLVLLHGYANGSLYFYRNLHGLSKFFGQIYALDMLGWGLSSRPSFKLSTKNNSSDDDASNTENEKVKSAEQFFVESLESWRVQHNLPKMTLAGHSMGGYLSAAYAEQYPQHVEKLILLSPVGVPQKIEQEDEERINSSPFYIRALIRTVRGMFNCGITPGYFLRSLPYSKSREMVSGYITNRLPAITCEEEQSFLGEYLYQNSMLPGSGEDCLCDILTAGAFAKVPLIHRIPKLRGGNGKDGLEVHFVYGERDWMDFKGGMDVQRLCHERNQQTTTSGTSQLESNPAPKVFVHGVRNAGHLLMLENYQEFNAAMAIAAGREGDLPSGISRSIEFVCDEVAAAVAADGSGVDKSPRFVRSNGQRAVMNERDAAKFFRGGRFSRRNTEQNANNESVLNGEEKKE